MNNVKLGFQFGIGFFLAKMLMSTPAAMTSPRVKREFEKLKREIDKAMGKEVEPIEEKPTKRGTSAFPQCKNKIGFAIE